MKMRRIFGVPAVLLILFIFLAAPGAAFAATLKMVPPSGTINKGCTIQLQIELDTQGSETDGTDVVLTFDPAALSATNNSIVNGTIYQDYPGNSVTGNKISISGLAPATQPFSGKGTFATINFTVGSAAAGVTQVRFDFDPQDRTKTTDTNVVQGGAEPVDVLTSVTDGAYTIGTGTSCTGFGQVGNPPPPPPPGGPISSASATPTQPPSNLPETAITAPTFVLVAVGAGLTLLGVLGLALF